jgi:hypothetical protein
MKARQLPNQALLREVFQYHPEGYLVWAIKRQKVIIGRRAGTPHCRDGYSRLCFNYIKYLEHRLIWVWHHGDIPDGLQVDHINRVRDPSPIENLRLVTHSGNCRNSGLRSDNTSGYIGVSKVLNGWGARYKNKCLGTYNTPEEASATYQRFKQQEDI